MFSNIKARAADFQKSVSANGVLDTLKLIYSTFADLKFDKEIGFSTQEPKLLPGLIEFNSEKHEGSLYLPARGEPFKKFLTRQKFSRTYTFTDIGCGRGRVLWLAKEYGFAKVIGIELDAELAADAKKNLSAKGLNEGSDFEIHAMNAADYVASADKNIFFFYGPYISDSDLMAVLKNLTRKKKETGEDQYMVYHCNVTPDTPLDRNSAFLKVGDVRILGNRYFIYKAV